MSHQQPTKGAAMQNRVNNSALARILKLPIIFERLPVQNCLKWPTMG